MQTETVQLEWRGGAFAVVWKVPGIPICGSCSRESKDKRNNRSAGSSVVSVCAWATDRLDGKWEAASSLTQACAGLLLLSRPGASLTSSVRGTYAVLVVPRTAEDLGAAARQICELREEICLLGGPLDHGRIVQDNPSGNFGHVALVEIDVTLSGSDAISPLKIILALQDLGASVVRLGRKRSKFDIELDDQSSTQADVLEGSCIAVVGIQAPKETFKPASRASYQKANRPGLLTHEVPPKWLAFMKSELALVNQRQCSANEITMFRGLEFLAPREQLRPRPSSGALVDAALASVSDAISKIRVLDLGVGCGALLLSTLHVLGCNSCGTGVDLDEAAVQICQTNASRILMPDHAKNVTVVLADFGQLDSPAVRPKLFDEGYDIIICNPPYRSVEQQAAYDRSCGRFGGHSEDIKTLVAGETGLEAYESIAACLSRDAMAIKQHQGKEVGAILRRNGTIIFQVEAGSHGTTGGVAARVAAAVGSASGGQLVLHNIHVDEKGLERAIVLKHSDVT